MYVSYDPSVGATYVRFADGSVARTVHVSDLVMVDVDAAGSALGVEFVVPIGEITDRMLKAVAAEFPELEALVRTDWRLAPA